MTIKQLSLKGAAIYGFLPGGFEYQLQHGVRDIPVDGGLAKRILDYAPPGATVISTDVTQSTVFNLAWVTPLEGLRLFETVLDYHFVIDTSLATIDSEGEIVMSAVEYTYEDFLICFEYRFLKSKQKVPEFSIDSKNYSEAYYAYMTYRFTQWFEVGTYYSVDYFNKHDKDGDNYVLDGLPKELAWLKDWALSLRFDMNDYWIFKLEGHYMDGLIDVDYGDEVNPDPNWFLFAAKISYSF